MKKIFLFPIFLIIGLHAIEQPSSPLKPSSRTTQANDISLGCALMAPGCIALVIGSTCVLTNIIEKKRLCNQISALIFSAIGAVLIGSGYMLRNKKTLLKHETPLPLSNKEKGAMLASLGWASSLFSIGPALKNTHHLDMEHLCLIAGIIGIGVGVKVYNTDASKQVEEFAR
jgi:hypothetical protein